MTSHNPSPKSGILARKIKERLTSMLKETAKEKISMIGARMAMRITI